MRTIEFLILVLICFIMLLGLYQLRTTTRQILKATISYTLVKDGERLMYSIDPKVLDIIENSSEVDEEYRAKVNKAIDRIIRYYASAFSQYAAHNIDKNEWEIMLTTFRAFLKKPIVKKYWEDNIVPNYKAWGPNFVKLGNKIY